MRQQRAFTFIELIVVLLIIGLTFAAVNFYTGTTTYWREEGFIRRFSETLQFLHNQAISDQTTYLVEIDMAKSSYRCLVLKDQEAAQNAVRFGDEVGLLSLELSMFLNPPMVTSQTFTPPPSFPSLAESQILPGGMQFKQIRTAQGIVDPTKRAFITFSPRGFSEFGVIQMTQSSGAPLTFVINPFTGIVDIYREYKDFEWTYGTKKQA